MKSNSNVKILIIVAIIIIFIVVVTLVSIYAFRKKDNYTLDNDYVSLKGDNIQVCSADKCKIIPDVEMKADISKYNVGLNPETVNDINDMVKAMSTSESETEAYEDYMTTKINVLDAFGFKTGFVPKKAAVLSKLIETCLSVYKKATGDNKLDEILLYHEVVRVTDHIQVHQPLYYKLYTTTVISHITTTINTSTTLGGYIAKLVGPKNSWIIVFRGTKFFHEVFEDIKVITKRSTFGPGSVHTGFSNLYEAPGKEIEAWLKTLTNDQDLTIHITGHSMGGALAILALHHINKFNPAIAAKTIVIGFGTPSCILDKTANDSIKPVINNVLLINNNMDPVVNKSQNISGFIRGYPVFDFVFKPDRKSFFTNVAYHMMKSYMGYLNQYWK